MDIDGFTIARWFFFGGFITIGLMLPIFIVFGIFRSRMTIRAMLVTIFIYGVIFAVGAAWMRGLPLVTAF